MKEVHKIVINEDSDFWKSMREVANLDAEKAAAKAAEQARKETLARAEKRASEHKAYLESIKDYDKLEFKHESLRVAIKEIQTQNNKYYAKISENNKSQCNFINDLQNKCCHLLVIERKTSYRDEYDSWHDGPKERKCVECFLEEKEERYVEEPYEILGNSQVVLLRKTVDEKEFELEFDDLKW